MEGLPTTPYISPSVCVWQCKSVNKLDPSGKMSLNEATITTAIIGNLSAIALGTCTETGQQAYADFEEYISLMLLYLE
jgi:hypothetical protein